MKRAKGRLTKYIEIYEWVKQQIESKKLKSGERIYSENELMELFSVSRQTVRQALSKLEYEKAIERRQGSGTYVCEKTSRSMPVNSMQIAVITTYVDEYIFPKIIGEIESTISHAGYTMQIMFTHNSVEKERAILQKLLKENMVDGIIIEPTKSALPNPNIAVLEQMIAAKIPLVFLNSYYPGLQVPYVSLNDKLAGKAATKHLIEQGHRKIGAVFKSDDGQGHLRYAGYVEALLEEGYSIREQHIIWITTEDIRHMEKEADRYLNKIGENTAYLCYNDKVASYFMKILDTHHISVPEAISVMGIDDADMAKHMKVPLTTMQNPLKSLGAISAEVLLKQIRGEQVERKYELPPLLIKRDSVKKVTGISRLD